MFSLKPNFGAYNIFGSEVIKSFQYKDLTRNPQIEEKPCGFSPISKSCVELSTALLVFVLPINVY